ncbi:DUF1232 domain-containing protein [Senegalia massiliensis]|uniref:DUF1232 domain-containing protein n=2 Tax=Senegalia massiliensis TaxID=1720316 RepID=A0A845QUJ8_9CLOT|nr:DUF1232 domain-containing protein [Senegalia massiliensis]
MSRFIYKLSMIPKFFKDRDVSLPKKALIVLAAMYLVFPFDIIPDPILFLGWIDDIVIFLYTYSKLSDYLEKYIPKKKNVVNFKNKNVVEDVEYDIKDKE